jgi:hypothetical protein
MNLLLYCQFNVSPVQGLASLLTMNLRHYINTF